MAASKANKMNYMYVDCKGKRHKLYMDEEGRKFYRVRAIKQDGKGYLRKVYTAELGKAGKDYKTVTGSRPAMRKTDVKVNGRIVYISCGRVGSFKIVNNKDGTRSRRFICVPASKFTDAEKAKIKKMGGSFPACRTFKAKKAAAPKAKKATTSGKTADGKSKKRVARGKALAKKLGRDARGRFVKA